MSDHSTVRDVLVHVDATKSARARVQLAVRLAAQFGARLTGLHVITPPDVSHRYRPSDVAAAQIKLERRLAAESKASARIFHDETRAQRVPTHWTERKGDVAKQVCFCARHVDLVLIGQYEVQEPIERHPLPTANSVVLGCGRPVIVVPEGIRSFEFGKIVIAWDGSREAVRAVHDAMPLLRLAHSVEILSVVSLSNSTGHTDLKELEVHLANHGIRVAAKVLSMKSGSDHVHLRNHISSAAYDLVVMGAYSHSPLLEFVLGGATQSILSTATIPVLVAH